VKENTVNHVRTHLDVTSLNQDSLILSACFNTSVKSFQWKKLFDINDIQMKKWYQMNNLLLSEKFKTMMNEEMMNDLNVIREALIVKILWQFQNFWKDVVCRFIV